MQSPDDPLTSPYSTSSFNNSFGGIPPDPSTYHRYEDGETAGAWLVPAPQDTLAHSGGFDNSQMQQSFDYSVLGPYMVAQPAMYGQPAAHGSSALCSPNQQPGPFSPVAPAPGTPNPSPSTGGAQGVHYRDSSNAGYLAQYQAAARPSASYASPETMTRPTDYSAMEGARPASREPLYRNPSASSHESARSKTYATAPYQNGPRSFTFVTPQVGGTASESSSFASDTGPQHTSQKAPKKRTSGAGTRRPRKPPVEPVPEPKLQTAPVIARNASRTASPKRAKTATDNERRTAFDTTPKSSTTVSPGGVSKAVIGPRSRSSTATSQTPKDRRHPDGPGVQTTEGSHRNCNSDCKILYEALQREIQNLKKGSDELKRDVQWLRQENSVMREEHSVMSRQQTDQRKDVTDLKCKVLEMASHDAMVHRGISPRADVR